MHITMLRGKKEAEVDDDEEEGDPEIVWERVVVKRDGGEGVPEGDRRMEVIPKMRAGERYEMDHKENGQKRKIKVISRAGKATSKK